MKTILAFILAISLWTSAHTVVQAQVTLQCGNIIDSCGFPSPPVPAFYTTTTQLLQYTPTALGIDYPRVVNVVLHLVANSSGQLAVTPAQATASINQLNEAFNTSGIAFAIIKTDTITNSDYYNINPILRFDLFQQNRVPKALNIYYVNTINGANGWAEGVPGRAFMIAKNFILTPTMAHEVGHCFWLYHTFEQCRFGKENIERTVGQPCFNALYAGDQLHDTNAEFYEPNVRTPCENLHAFGTNPQNFMTWNNASPSMPDPRNQFTEGQLARMHYILTHNLVDLLEMPVYLANRYQNELITNTPTRPSTLTANNTTVLSGQSLTFLRGSEVSARTNQERFIGYVSSTQGTLNIKHHNWNETSLKFRLSQSFIVSGVDSMKQNSFFLPYQPATVRASLIDGPNFDWAGVQFRDPWRVDSQGNQPDAFAFYPSTSNNTNGVFLGQLQQQDNPFYSVRAGDTVITSGGITGVRVDRIPNLGMALWEGTGVSIQNPNAIETPVVFTAPNAVVSARYKGRLLSSLANATSAGNQRRLANAQGATLYNNVFYLVYESAGKIWLTYTTDGGTSWTNEQYLGDGKNPTVAASSGTALIAWNTGTGQLACRQFIYDPLSPSLSPTLLIPYGNRVTPDAKVIIALPPNHQSTLQATLFCEVSVLNNPAQTRLGGVRVSFSGNNGTISSSYDILNSPIFSSPNASMDIAAIQEEATFGNKIHLVHTNYGNGAPYPVYYATVNTSGSLTYTPVLQMTDNVFATWQPKNLTITLDSLNNKHIAWDAYQSALNTQVLIYRSISANNQSVSPSTRLYSQNGGYRKPSINFFNGTVSLVWQTDDGWTAFGSRQLNNSNWYSFGFQQGWSSANTTIRGGKRFVRTKTGNAPYFIAQSAITVSGSSGGGGGDSQARSLSGGGSDAEVQSQTLGGGVGQDDVPFFPVERTTGVLSNQTETASLALTLADVGLNGSSRTGLTYHDLGANLLPDTLALSPSNVFSLLKSRRFTLADTINQITATVKVHSKSLYDLTQQNPVQLAVELFNAATNHSIALSQTALVTASDTAKDIHFTMNLPTGQSGTEVELRVKVLGFAIQASHKASALNEIELVSGAGGTAIVNRVGNQAAQTETIGSVPTKFALHQNYPNPFNPTTVIRYELPSNSRVKVQVFDVLGRVLATLVNERREAGIYEAVFNASSLSSGTYFYRLEARLSGSQAGSFVETKKMMLVK